MKNIKADNENAITEWLGLFPFLFGILLFPLFPEVNRKVPGKSYYKVKKSSFSFSFFFRYMEEKGKKMDATQKNVYEMKKPKLTPLLLPINFQSSFLFVGLLITNKTYTLTLSHTHKKSKTAKK